MDITEGLCHYIPPEESCYATVLMCCLVSENECCDLENKNLCIHVGLVKET